MFDVRTIMAFSSVFRVFRLKTLILLGVLGFGAYYGYTKYGQHLEGVPIVSSIKQKIEELKAKFLK